MAKNFTSGTIYLTISSFVFLISSYFINIYLGRQLGIIDYGVYGLVISIMTNLNLIQIAGIPQGVSKYVAEEPNKSESILKSGLLLQLILTIVVTAIYFFLSFPLSILLGDTSLAPVLGLSAFILVPYGFHSVYVGYFNGLQNFKTQAIISIAYAVSKTLLVIILTYFLKIYGAILGFIFSSLIALFFGFHWPSKKVQKFSYKKLAFFSLPQITTAVLSTLLISLDLFLLKILSPSEYAPGYFTVAQNISRLPYFALMAFAAVLYPHISQSIRKKDFKRVRQLIEETMRYALILLAFSTIVVNSTSAELITLLYSDLYLPATNALNILIFATSFITILIILLNIISASGEPSKSATVVAVGVIITGICCYLLIPVNDLEGAALSTTIGCLITMLVSAIIVYDKFKTLIKIRSFTKILFSATVAFFAASFISGSQIMVLLMKFFIIVVSYFFLLAALKELTYSDLNRFSTLIPNKFKPLFNKFKD